MDEGIVILSTLMTMFVFIYLVIRTKHKHELAKLDRLAQGNSDRSLTTGELENMIRDAVSDMTTPLRDQVDELSRRLDASSDTRLLDTIDDPGDARTEEKTLGRRTRT